MEVPGDKVRDDGDLVAARALEAEWQSDGGPGVNPVVIKHPELPQLRPCQFERDRRTDATEPDERNLLAG